MPTLYMSEISCVCLPCPDTQVTQESGVDSSIIIIIIIICVLAHDVTHRRPWRQQRAGYCEAVERDFTLSISSQ